MTTVEVTLDESTAAFVEEERKARGFDTSAEYIQFVLAEKQLTADPKRLEALLLEGLASGPGEIVDEGFWQQFELKHLGRVLDHSEDVA